MANLTYLINSTSLFLVSFGTFYSLNYFSVIIKVLIASVWLVLIVFSSSLIKKLSYGIAELPLLAYLALAFSITAISTSHLMLFLICLEGLSLILYIMATTGRLQGGITGATKYFAFGTVGSILVLWGTINLYEVTSSLSYTVLFQTFNCAFLGFVFEAGVSAKLFWSGALVVVGLLIKLGASPSHQ